jgi:hypothetical protein
MTSGVNAMPEDSCPGPRRASLPLPGESYLDQRGLMVFTARYHLRRGYCCGNACRHCPFDATGAARPPVEDSIVQTGRECCTE